MPFSRTVGSRNTERNQRGISCCNGCSCSLPATTVSFSLFVDVGLINMGFEMSGIRPNLNLVQTRVDRRLINHTDLLVYQPQPSTLERFRDRPGWYVYSAVFVHLSLLLLQRSSVSPQIVSSAAFHCLCKWSSVYVWM